MPSALSPNKLFTAFGAGVCFVNSGDLIVSPSCKCQQNTAWTGSIYPKKEGRIHLKQIKQEWLGNEDLSTAARLYLLTKGCQTCRFFLHKVWTWQTRIHFLLQLRRWSVSCTFACDIKLDEALILPIDLGQKAYIFKRSMKCNPRYPAAHYLIISFNAATRLYTLVRCHTAFCFHICLSYNRLHQRSEPTT